ncbi:hypothetical protein [Methylococcus sp. Mc7]|uniref:hypothetical protein n=1 Tax=Methylococcus sp. Mc7 TaxID=2860258 RepID=UPI001C529857|nr:hypothetical protein [Methylococcus sp. Mc7]QXP84388.1 hypothetical protein KW115_01040 [Methylococcus sp. Mc7]
MDHRHFVLDVMMVMVPVETIGMAVAMVMAVMVLVVVMMVAMMFPPGHGAVARDERNQKNEGRDKRLLHGDTSGQSWDWPSPPIFRASSNQQRNFL